MNKRTCNIGSNGDIHWSYINGSVYYNHNNNGPAREYANGNKFWWVNDKRHRLDGPAVEILVNDKRWYINGVKYNNEFEYWIAVQQYDNTHA